jgi:hypothetical protein
MPAKTFSIKDIVLNCICCGNSKEDDTDTEASELQRLIDLDLNNNEINLIELFIKNYRRKWSRSVEDFMKTPPNEIPNPFEEKTFGIPSDKFLKNANQ